jgi:hypothetical protein
MLATEVGGDQSANTTTADNSTLAADPAQGTKATEAPAKPGWASYLMGGCGMFRMLGCAK